MAPMLTETEFQEQLNDKLRELAELCQEHWGDAPELDARVVPAMKVSCNFDLGDFPHRGRSFLIHQGNSGRRTPERIALEIMREVADHRNRCDRCGLGIPGIQQRMHRAEQLVCERDHPAKPAREPFGQLLARAERENYLTPPDIPEQMLFPVNARRLEAAIACLRAGQQ